MTTSDIPSFVRRLTVMVFFAVVLIPVLLLGYDGPWLGGGDIDIRGRAPFPKKFYARHVPRFRRMVCRSRWAALPVDLCRVGASRRPAAASARPPHLLRPQRLDVLDRRRREYSGDDGGFAEPVAVFAARACPRRRQHPRGPRPVRAMRDTGDRRCHPEQADDLRKISVQRRRRGAGDALRLRCCGS